MRSIMKRFILSAAVLVIVGGMFTGSAEAQGRGRGHERGHGHDRGYHREGHGHGHYRTFPHGYRSWGRYWYSPRYRCGFYYNTSCNDWFYYHAPQQQYLPVSQIATYPPTINIVNNNNNSNTNVGGPIPGIPVQAAPPPFDAPLPGPGPMPPGPGSPGPIPQGIR
jgi:hypothetical protein